MPHYTTFDVNTAVQPAQVITVPRASEPVPPRSSTAPQATPMGSPLIINLATPVQFNTGGVDVGTSPAGNQSAGARLIGNDSADATMEPAKPMASPSGMAKDSARTDLIPLPPLPPMPPPSVSEKSTKSEDVCVSVGRRVSVSGCADL